MDTRFTYNAAQRTTSMCRLPQRTWRLLTYWGGVTYRWGSNCNCLLLTFRQTFKLVHSQEIEVKSLFYKILSLSLMCSRFCRPAFRISQQNQYFADRVGEGGAVRFDRAWVRSWLLCVEALCYFLDNRLKRRTDVFTPPQALHQNHASPPCRVSIRHCENIESAGNAPALLFAIMLRGDAF